jgi:uncharacterized protein (TIGR04255 family)
MQLPTALKNPPLVEAVVEIRFDAEVPDDVVAAMVWSALKDDYENFKPNAMHNIPSAVRSKDPNLMYLPDFTLDNKVSRIDVGAKSFVFRLKKYSQWDDFISVLGDTFEKVRNNIKPRIQRIGLRYVNKLELDLFTGNRVEVSIKFSGIELSDQDTVVRTTFVDGDVKIAVVCASQREKQGWVSYIDIDAFVESQEILNSKDLVVLLNVSHEALKKKFFSILSQEYIQELGPEY